MSMVINTNTGSLIAQRAAADTASSMDTAMERLSTGKKINSASDDAAGMAMVTRMESQIKGLTMAMKNAGDAQSLVDTAEGAMDEIANILQRMRELAVQSASDVNTASDRRNLNTEITNLTAEIDRISSQTTWNGTTLLDGTYTGKSFQIGPESGQTVSVSVSDLASASLGATTAESMGFITTDTDGDVAGDHGSNGAGVTYTLTGPEASANIVVADDLSAKATAALFNAATATTGVSATAKTVVKLSGLTLTTDASATVSFNLNDVAVSGTNVTASDLRGLMTAINDKSAQTGVTAKLGGSNAELILTDLDGDDIAIEQFDTTDSTAVADQLSHIDVTVLQSDETTSADDVVELHDISSSNAGANFHDANITGTVALSANGTFSITGGASTVDAFDGTSATDVATTTVSTVSVTTAANASAAIKTIDGALSKIAEQRADLGAISNRLDYTISNLGSVKVNMQASQSRIQDADFAIETSNLTKSQILSQAATAMLAQANASKQSVLSLLQG